MFRFLSALFATMIAVLSCVAPSIAGNVEVKGPHICCKQCSNIVGAILGKVDGVTEVKADAKTKTVTFAAKDESAAKAGVTALIEGGFFGQATHDGKDLKIKVATPEKGAKTEVVTVKDVHVCCKACQNGIQAVFGDAKITYTGKGPQKVVRIEGATATSGEVIEILRKAGFNGTLEK